MTVTLSWRVQNFVVIGRLHFFNQITSNFGLIWNSIEKSLVGRAPGRYQVILWFYTVRGFDTLRTEKKWLTFCRRNFKWSMLIYISIKKIQWSFPLGFNWWSASISSSNDLLPVRCQVITRTNVYKIPWRHIASPCHSELTNESDTVSHKKDKHILRKMMIAI